MSSDWTCWSLGALLGLVGVWLLYQSLLADRANGQRRCDRCWYDMRGIKGLRCPECGNTAKHERQLFKTRRRWRMALIAFVALIVATTLSLTPKVREDGLASIMPTTALILIQRYRDDTWAYVEVLDRVVVRRRDRSEDRPPWRLNSRQWRMLTETCLYSVRQAENPDVLDMAVYILTVAAELGVDRPEGVGPALAEYIRGPRSREMDRLRRELWEDDFADWLGDEYNVIHDAVITRLKGTRNRVETYRLSLTVFYRRSSDSAVAELLDVIPQMSDASCVEEVVDLVFSEVLGSQTPGWSASATVVARLVSILSCDYLYARNYAELLLAYPVFVDPQQAVVSLRHAIESGDPTIDKDKIRTTISVIELLTEEGFAEKIESDDAAAGAILLRVLTAVDFDLAMFLIRHELEDSRPGDTDTVLSMLLPDEEQSEVSLKILFELARDDDPDIRIQVPSFALEMGSRAVDALPILEALRDDETDQVRTEAERVIERISSRGGVAH